MKRILGLLGPGLLYAGAAVGVSHLVQSTRAGAEYGMLLIPVIIAANLIKYPFFKAGPLFAAAEGKSLLSAFYEQGKAAMLLFYLITISGMFVVQAAVTYLTASVLSSIFNIAFPLDKLAVIILFISAIILLIGKYNLLSKLMKWIIILLAVATLVALVAAVNMNGVAVESSSSFSLFNTRDLFFLIALIGWMPAPLDVVLWQSEWVIESKNRDASYSKKIALFDFKVGYWGTTFLAVAFASLGALILGNSAVELSDKGAVFAGQLIEMYTNTIGDWAFVIIAIAAFTTMFSTTLTVLDAYPRVLKKAIDLSTSNKLKHTYTVLLFALISGSTFILLFKLDNMKQLIDFATTTSFLLAPLLASMILYTVSKSKQQILSKFEKVVAWLGLLFLYGFSFYYLVEVNPFSL